MDHRIFQEQLMALHDGALEGPARQALERHLQGCAGCRAQLAEWQQIARAAFAAAPPVTSEAFVDRVMQRILPVPAARPATRLSRWWAEAGWLFPAMGLAALLLVLLTGPAQSTSVDQLLLSQEAGLETDEDVLALLMEESL